MSLGNIQTSQLLRQSFPASSSPKAARSLSGISTQQPSVLLLSQLFNLPLVCCCSRTPRIAPCHFDYRKCFGSMFLYCCRQFRIVHQQACRETSLARKDSHRWTVLAVGIESAICFSGTSFRNSGLYICEVISDAWSEDYMFCREWWTLFIENVGLC